MSAIRGRGQVSFFVMRLSFRKSSSTMLTPTGGTKPILFALLVAGLILVGEIWWARAARRETADE